MIPLGLFSDVYRGHANPIRLGCYQLPLLPAHVTGCGRKGCFVSEILALFTDHLMSANCVGVDAISADRTAAQYDWLLASSCRPSVCLSVTLCIVALRVGVQG